ncbi:MAG: FMN-binding glutamate synthase family protein [Actinomycetota bacterium]|nr:FMN-binding glutamate synthase family protein [Actinomycetota bacterium]MDI6821667.1 FMN-binding glutamate synthase family protein [Actinomycetota bacterium]
MSLSRPNASAATITTTRVTPSPISGLCVACVDGCPGYCEVGRSAVRGREIIYPHPFGKVIAGAEKDYPVDFSHFNIQGSCVGAAGIEADPDKAIFPAVDVSTEIGARGRKMKMKVPFFTGALGSTDVARVNWEGAAIAVAICGAVLICGENVCGMDPDAEFKNGKVVRSPELERRVKIYKEWYEGYGTMLVQANVEDTRLGVPEYAVEKLGVEGIEIKWGQGAKSIGGEVKLPTLERALELKQRGYIVIPDPNDSAVQEAYKAGGVREFERHSRLGMVDEESFLKEVERLKNIGAKYVTLKTGAYRPADLARAVKFASEAKIDLLTVDGAGGGTGMSPWVMMNEWGIPTVYLESLLYKFLKRIEEKGAFVPSCAIAGGIVLEDQIFKAIALGAPYIKAVCMGRGTLTAAMVGKTQGQLLEETYGKGKEYQEALLRTFIGAVQLKEKYGEDFKRMPPAAIAVYTYYDRIATGLKQLMAGARKFALNLIDRNDLFALTREAAELSGITYIMESDMEEAERILG